MVDQSFTVHNYLYILTKHAIKRQFQRGICTKKLIEGIRNGAIKSARNGFKLVYIVNAREIIVVLVPLSKRKYSIITTWARE